MEQETVRQDYPKMEELLQKTTMKDPIRSIIIDYGNFLFRYRNAVFPLVLLTLVVAFEPGQPLGSPGEAWVDLLGLLVSGVGQGIHMTVLGLVNIGRGGKQVHADSLITGGIYAHCRNPLYLGNLFILGGLFILYNSFWVYVLGSLFFLTAYASIVEAEEFFLREKFGMDHDVYCQQVNRWWLNFHGIKKTINVIRFNWLRVITKGYASAYNWITAAILFLAYKSLARSHSLVLTSDLIGLGIAFGIMTISACTVRYLKKSGRLVT